MMGTYYSAAIIVGLTREEIDNQLDINTTLDDILGPSNDIGIFATMFDGYNEECTVVGYLIQQAEEYSSSELEYNQAFIDEKIALFHKVTGLKPKVRLSLICS